MMHPRARPFTVTFQTVSTRIVTTGRALIASTSASPRTRVAHAPEGSLRKVTGTADLRRPLLSPPAGQETSPLVTHRHTDFGKPLRGAPAAHRQMPGPVGLHAISTSSASLLHIRELRSG